jgi:competence protein ComEA
MPGDRVRDAIQAAGGLLAEADASSLNLAAPLHDGERLVVASLKPAAASSTPLVTGGHAGQVPESQQDAPALKININTATLQELDDLPGIGPSIAQRILDHRQSNGPFASPEAIQEVPGIGPATYERIREWITVEAGP